MACLFSMNHVDPLCITVSCKKHVADFVVLKCVVRKLVSNDRDDFLHEATLRPNLMPGESITSACQLQCASLDISPTSITGATKKLKQSKPITPISIHIRRPTVKASVHGRNT